MEPSHELKSYFDETGRLKVWPSPRNRKRAQGLALEFLASRFEPGRRYTEKEVNTLLNGLHTFGDPAMLRREMIVNGLLQRRRDGSEYWRPDPPQTAEVA